MLSGPLNTESENSNFESQHRSIAHTRRHDLSVTCSLDVVLNKPFKEI